MAVNQNNVFNFMNNVKNLGMYACFETNQLPLHCLSYNNNIRWNPSYRIYPVFCFHWKRFNAK